MSGNRLGIKSAKGTGTSGFITKSNVNIRSKKKTHRYLHESDMEDSEEEEEKKKEERRNSLILERKNSNDSTKRINNIADILNLKKEQIKKDKLNKTHSHSKIVYKYVNKLQDFIEDNYIDLGDQLQLVLDKYKEKLLLYFENDLNNPQKENKISISHELLNYKKQLKLLLENNQNVNLNIINDNNSGYNGNKPQLEY